MFFPSRFPERHLWEAVETGYVRQKRCTHDALPLRLFCGKAAVSGTDEGRPRCEEHQEADGLAAAAPPHPLL